MVLIHEKTFHCKEKPQKGIFKHQGSNKKKKKIEKHYYKVIPTLPLSPSLLSFLPHHSPHLPMMSLAHDRVSITIGFFSLFNLSLFPSFIFFPICYSIFLFFVSTLRHHALEPLSPR